MGWGGGGERNGRDKRKERKKLGGREENGKGMREEKRKLNKSWRLIVSLIELPNNLFFV